MSQIRETIDLEAEIEALIKQAGDSLRQPVDARPSTHDAESGLRQTTPSAKNVMSAPLGRVQ